MGPNPQQMPDWLNLALQADQLYTQGRFDDAVHAATLSLQLNPDCAVALQVLGLVDWQRGLPHDGIARLHRAVAVRPDLPSIHNALGLCYAQLGDHARALHHYDIACVLKPDHPHARFNRAMQLLRHARYPDGWVEYEWRWASGQLTWPEIPRPKWDGSPLNGRSVLIHTEQGVGDVLMFMRFLPRIKQPGDRLVFACQKALQPLLKNQPWVDTWFPIDEPAPINFDVYLPLISLPAMLGADERAIPHPVPYVTPDPALVEKWKPRVAALPGFKVGICWQGSPTFKGDQFRSVPLQHFAAVAAVPGVTLVSLQKGAGTEQLELNKAAVPVTVFPDLDEAAPFVDTAAVMQQLDLIITSDTAIAHLAGALGRPVWVALSLDCDWRWEIGRSDSRWYPTMRLFRQKTFGDWPGVFADIAAALPPVVAGRAVAPPPPARPAPQAPVSAGELIDKITILEIKLQRITNETKRANVLKELELLRAARQEAVPPSPKLDELTTLLRAVNERLWDIEDALRKCERSGQFEHRFVALARSVYKNNDERAALKRRINDLLGSPLVEEKSYAC
jgi:hypothetical protein